VGSELQGFTQGLARPCGSSLQGKELDPVQHLSRLYRLTQELQVADAGAHVGTELPGEHNARKRLAETLPARSLTEQIGVHRKKKPANRGCAVQEVAVRRFSCSVFLSRQDIDPP
jgi:hypothetical protein